MKKINSEENGGKVPLNATVDPELIVLLKRNAKANDRNFSNTVQLAIKTFLALEKAKDPVYWKQEYGNVEL